MSYDKVQAVGEFGRWSQGYDRCILQRLLFGPSHRAIIARVRARSGEGALAILDVGCGTGVFASRISAASPRSTVWGVDLVSAMLVQGKSALAKGPGARRRGPGGQRAPALRSRCLRRGDVRQQFPPLSAPGSCRRRDAPCPQTRRAAVPGRRLSRWPLGMVHLRRLCRRRGGGRPARLGPQDSQPVPPGWIRRDEPEGLSRPGPFPSDRGSGPLAGTARLRSSAESIGGFPERSRPLVKILVAAVQMPAELSNVAANLERADAFWAKRVERRRAGGPARDVQHGLRPAPRFRPHRRGDGRADAAAPVWSQPPVADGDRSRVRRARSTGTSTTRWPSACPMARSRSIASGTWSSGSGSASAPGDPR